MKFAGAKSSKTVWLTRSHPVGGIGGEESKHRLRT